MSTKTISRLDILVDGATHVPVRTWTSSGTSSGTAYRDDLFPELAPNIDGDMANDRYTTRPTLEWCKGVLSVDAFDLDVAACVEAHHAPDWYGRQTDGAWIDGLILPWSARRIWCNPPYDNIEPWVCRAWETTFRRNGAELLGANGVIGMLIPDNRREQPFWQSLIEPFRDGRWERSETLRLSGRRSGKTQWQNIMVAHDAGARLFTHSLPGRQPFGVPGNPEGVGQQSPPFGVVLLEFRF